MADREKIIKGLEACIAPIECSPDKCPYYIHESGFCTDNLMTDALTLLKEQEVEISRLSNAYLELVRKASKQPEIVRCKDCTYLNADTGICIVGISVKQFYCPNCNQNVIAPYLKTKCPNCGSDLVDVQYIISEDENGGECTVRIKLSKLR